MPTRWQLLLRPSDTTRATRISPAQLHGLACRILEGAAADHYSQIKPFTITPVVEAPHTPGCATLALSWLDDHTTPPLDTLRGEHIRLGSQFFTIESVNGSSAPYAALQALPTTRRATLNFLSVTYFTRSGRWIPLPDPELLYSGLARRWNTFAPHPLPDPLITALRNTVRLTTHELRSAPADLGPASRTGFTGHSTFTLPHTAPDDLASAFTALSAYAEAAGIGAQTTHGLGWTTTTLHPRRSTTNSQAQLQRLPRNRTAADSLSPVRI
ncbi:CRISPR system precrRNA processing endoribonuclease RAMP protein Cas6 [Streptomyces sp. NPDC001739]